jgi:hypothetical protein
MKRLAAKRKLKRRKPDNVRGRSVGKK